MLARLTDTKEIQPMALDFKSCFSGNLLGHISQSVQIGIDDLFAFYTHDVGVGKWIFAVIAIAAVGESQFQNFIQGFEQHNVAVNRCQTHGRKSFVQFTMNLLHAGMPFAKGQ